MVAARGKVVSRLETIHKAFGTNSGNHKTV